MTTSYSPRIEAGQFREQLSSDKRRVVFLFGAGTSQSVGIDGLNDLTNHVRSELRGTLRSEFMRLCEGIGDQGTVEHVLDEIRLCRQLLERRPTDIIRGLTAASAKELDRAICAAISERVSIEPSGGIEPHSRLAGWIRSISRAYPVEIFTTNYDVLIERGLEIEEVPHFDGFIGTHEPRFSAASVEMGIGLNNEGWELPRSWVRVWKLHGSVNWRLRRTQDGVGVLIRSPKSQAQADDDLMIFPSKEKYTESRKLPFVSFHDRFRRVLAQGEALLVTNGYSFGDQHINEIIFEALRRNNRLAVTALVYGQMSAVLDERLLNHAKSFGNLTIYAANEACVGGVRGGWSYPAATSTVSSENSSFWDFSGGEFTLGDFRRFCEYLRLSARGGNADLPLPVATQPLTTETLVTSRPPDSAGVATASTSVAPITADGLPNPSVASTQPEVLS